MKIKRLNKNAVIPKYATPGSAGFDLHSVENLKIESGKWKLVDTGLAMAIPEGYVGLLFPRSGNAVKYGVNLINCVGVIDSDYRDAVKIPLHNNNGDYNFSVYEGDRVGQMIIMPYEQVEFEEVDDLDETERNGGFGSTGI